MEYFVPTPSQENSPLLGISIAADATHVLAIRFVQRGEKVKLGNASPGMVHLLAASQIEEYLAGRRFDFSLPVRLTGTDFQKRVWVAMQDIPYGVTCSYGDLGKKLGDARMARAVGGAANRNPLPLVIPCHRVIGRNGSLTGFASGTAVKAYLLELERRGLAEHRGRSTSQ